jgi:DNA cross-link repair 1A protein
MDCISDPKDRNYFLTHYHGDHYGGLHEKWAEGRIYCSEISARLVINIMKVDPSLVTSIPMGGRVRIPGGTVIFLDANHCPGAAMLLFELDDGSVYLHTGDMRYDPKMKKYPHFNCNLHIDKIFLDTTYAHPKHKFAPQKDSIASIVKQCKEFLGNHPNGLILLSAYNIGKERIICKVLR